MITGESIVLEGLGNIEEIKKDFISMQTLDAHVESNEHVVVLTYGDSTNEEIQSAVDSGKPIVFVSNVQSGRSGAYSCYVRQTPSMFQIKYLDPSSGNFCLAPKFLEKGTWEPIVKTDIAFADKKETVLGTGSLADNTRYNVTAPVGTYAFKMSSGHASGIFTTDVAPAITFEPTAKFLGAVPEFKPSTTYEFDVQDNVWVFTEVVTA